MKKIAFYRNNNVYTPLENKTAIQVAKESISQLTNILDGEIVLARYKESQEDDTKSLICVYQNDGEVGNWTFFSDSNGGDYYTKEEIDEAGETIAQSLSEIDGRIIELSSLIDETNSVIENDEFVSAVALSNLDERVSENASEIELINQTISNNAKTPLRNIEVTSSSVTIEPYIMYNIGTISSSVSIVFDTEKEIPGYTKEYIIRFVAGSNCSITLPNSTLYPNGQAPTYTAGRTYEINVVNGCAVVGEFY